jgi:CPA2 family monovalent cation:H+ antiporter-2
MFSAIFFVTIGMMVNPSLLWKQKFSILLLLCAVLLFKTLTNAIVTFLAGQPYKESLTIGIGLAQLGDFSYLVALMGIKFTDGKPPFQEMYQLAVGVSVISTLVNPFLLKASIPFGRWLEQKLPRRLRNALENYTQWSNRAQQEIKSESQQGRLLRKHLLFYALDIILLIVVFIVMHFLAGLSFWGRLPAFLGTHRNIVVWLAGLLFLIPISVAAFSHIQQTARLLAESTAASFLPKSLFVHAKRLISAIVWTILLASYAVVLLAVANLLFTNLTVAAATIVALLTICIFARKKFNQIVLEGQQTLEHVLDETRTDAAEMPQETGFSVSFRIPDASCTIGRKLSTIRLRNRTGMSILAITRADGTQISNPGANETIQEGDTLSLAGTPQQFEKTRQFLAEKSLPQEELDSTAFYLNAYTEELSLPEDAPCNGRSIRETDLRNQTGVTVLRIRRADRSVLPNPGPNELLLAGDSLSLFGSPQQILSAKKILLPPRT